MKKPTAKAAPEQPTSTKHQTVRFSIGKLAMVKAGHVIHAGKLWSKEI
jgi:hypothetical protein